MNQVLFVGDTRILEVSMGVDCSCISVMCKAVAGASWSDVSADALVVANAADAILVPVLGRSCIFCAFCCRKNDLCRRRTVCGVGVAVAVCRHFFFVCIYGHIRSICCSLPCVSVGGGSSLVRMPVQDTLLLFVVFVVIFSSLKSASAWGCEQQCR